MNARLSLAALAVCCIATTAAFAQPARTSEATCEEMCILRLDRCLATGKPESQCLLAYNSCFAGCP